MRSYIPAMKEKLIILVSLFILRYTSHIKHINLDTAAVLCEISASVYTFFLWSGSIKLLLSQASLCHFHFGYLLNKKKHFCVFHYGTRWVLEIAFQKTRVNLGTCKAKHWSHQIINSNLISTLILDNVSVGVEVQYMQNFRSKIKTKIANIRKLVKALCHKMKSLELDLLWGCSIFQSDLIVIALLWPCVEWTSNTSENQETFLWTKCGVRIRQANSRSSMSRLYRKTNSRYLWPDSI